MPVGTVISLVVSVGDVLRKCRWNLGQLSNARLSLLVSAVAADLNQYCLAAYAVQVLWH